MSEPALGTARTVRRFAWCPVFLTDRRHWWDVTWFEPYTAHEVYALPDPDGWSSVSPGWITQRRHR